MFLSQILAARDVKIRRSEMEIRKFKSGRNRAAHEGKCALGFGGLPVVRWHQNLRGLTRQNIGAEAMVNGGALGGFGDGKC